MNSFGRLFRVEIFGESHGAAVGAIVDGCPPGIAVAAADFEADMARRRSGAAGTTERREADVPEILSGKRVVSLDLGAMIAGSRFRGEFEERLKSATSSLPRSEPPPNRSSPACGSVPSGNR